MLKKLIIATLVFILATVGVLAYLLDEPEQFRPEIERFAEEQLGYPVTFGELSWQWQPDFGLTMAELNVTPVDGEIKSLSSEEIKLKLSLWPILTQQSLRVQSIQLRGLQVVLNQSNRAHVDQKPTESDASTSDMAWMNHLDLLADEVRNALLLLQIDELAVERLTVMQANATEALLTVDAFHLASDESGLKVESEGRFGWLDDGEANQFKGALSLKLSLPEADPSSVRLMVSAEGRIQTEANVQSQPIKLDLTTEWQGSSRTLVVNPVQLASDGIKLTGQATLRPDATLLMNEQPFDISAQLSIEMQAISRTLLQSLDMEAPAFSNSSMTLHVTQLDRVIQATLTDGRIDGIQWSADANFNQPLDQLSIEVRVPELDLDELTKESSSEPESSSTAWDEPLVSPDMFASPQVNANLTVGQLKTNGLSISESLIQIATNPKTIEVSFEGNLLGGKVTAASTVHASEGETNPVQWQAISIDLNQLLAPLTPGRFSGKGTYEFEGVSLRQLADSLKGQSEFELIDAEFDMTALKSGLSMLDDLINTQSGAESWPDRARFEQAVGRHEAISGLASGQTFRIDLENIHLSGQGGMNLETGKANILLDLKLDESQVPPLPISGPITKVSWPIKCEGDIEAEITDLCTPDQERAKRLAGNILKAKVQDKGRQLLDGLIKGDDKGALKNLLKW